MDNYNFGPNLIYFAGILMIILYIDLLYYILYIIKTIATNPRRSIFEKCFKSRFDTVERKISTSGFDPAKKY